jgi:hypothetical protein
VNGTGQIQLNGRTSIVGLNERVLLGTGTLYKLQDYGGYLSSATVGYGADVTLESDVQSDSWTIKGGDLTIPVSGYSPDSKSFQLLGSGKGTVNFGGVPGSSYYYIRSIGEDVTLPHTLVERRIRLPFPRNIESFRFCKYRYY